LKTSPSLYHPHNIARINFRISIFRKMPSHHNDSRIRLPSGPYPSALPTLPSSFEPVHSIEQIDRPARLEELGVSPETLSHIHRKFNRLEFRVVNDARFEEIVLESVKRLTR
jgi:hypothetical protein